MAARLALFYAAIFLFGGIQMPYWPLWLEARGLSAQQIGFTLALAQAVKILAGPTGGWLADRRAQRRTPLMLLTGLALIGLALYLPAHGFLAVAMVTALVAACQAPVLPLADNLVLMTIRQHAGLDYGRLRLWGSITFIAGAAAVGALLVGRSPEIVLWLAIAAYGLTFATVVNLPDTRPQAVAGATRASPGWLFRRPAFLLVLAAGSLVQSSHAVLYGFSTLHWQANGIDSATIGMMWALSVVAEIALFAWGGPLAARLGVARLFLVSGVAGVLRWSLTGASTSLVVLLPAQTLHALTFGAAHLATMQFMSRAIPPQMSATAQSLYSAIGIGAVYGIAIWCSGGLYAALGGGAFHVMSGLSLAGCAAAMLLARRWKGEVLS